MRSKKLLALALALIMALAVMGTTMAETMKAGTYTKTVNGMMGAMTLEMTVTEDKIESFKVTENVETPGIGGYAATVIPERIVEQQTCKVDAVAGATVTSKVIMKAAEALLTEACADMAKFGKEAEKAAPKDEELTADVIVVGGGGAGLAAAVSAAGKGASVILIEKMGFLGGNSIVSGGIYNCPDPELQDKAEVAGDPHALVEKAIAEEPVSEEHKALIEAVKADFEAFKKTDKPLFDSANWFALQTWNGGDKVGNLTMVKTLTANAFDALNWLKTMGAEFEPKISHGAGSLYPRTHQGVKPNGTGYIDAFTQTLANNAQYTCMMNTEGKSLILDNGRVVGVNAEKRDGSKVVLHATKGVILATGGFAGNVKLREQYCQGEKWPYLGSKLPTSNVAGVTGDGIFMAQEAGAKLVNMEQIQLLHMCNPKTGATYDINRSYSNAIFVNKNGERFVREDGRRDDMSKAIIAQPDSIMYMLLSADSIPDPATSITLGGQSIQYLVENKVSGYVKADTIEEMAKILEMPADALKATVEKYNASVDSAAADEFGRVSYGNKLVTAPFYAYPRSPAAHHTMGGVDVDPACHALNNDGNVIPGLYCAGEITGNLHGGNRLGGNAIVDFTVFGRIAGESVVNDAK